ncbi:MAG: ribosome biogenesis GTPase YlqF [Bacillota bacterium]|nr:ribosome biogenesis GTPase YlqF [Bacillota bacterium]
MAINWYPGHMVKARREIEENIKLVDVVTMLLDARAPFSCRNHDLEKIAGRKKVVFVLTKMDLADPDSSREYVKQLRAEGHLVALIDSTSGKGSREVIQLIKTAFKEEEERLIARGRRTRAARVMVVGVPNIGKSTFLNCMVGKKMAQTGAKPGVTRGKQWVRVREDIEFMDTPGLMWPKVEVEEQGRRLALLDIVGENAYSDEEVALYLLKNLQEKHVDILQNKFKLTPTSEQTPLELLEEIAKKRGHLLKGGKLDLDKTCKNLLQDFRKGHLGQISLD